MIYGFRISVLFGLTLTVFSALIGIARARCRAISADGPTC
jgi:ABC-type microcin C transport system permease subunit YejE